MAIVVVQVGQCGNQLGDELFTQLAISIAGARERDAYLDSAFFCNDGMARCVLVDSEPKVVKGVLARHETFIRPTNVVCGQSGRGNNWGMGFNGVKETEASSSPSGGAPPPPPQPPSARTRRRGGGGGGGARHGNNSSRRASADVGFQKLYKAQRADDERLLTKALRAIHLETRRTADSEGGFEAILLLHSLSGGTGSGLASRLAEKIRFYFVEPPPGQSVDDRYEARMMSMDGLDGMLVEKRRARYLVSVAVAPQACGELALQGINAALTLYTMHKYADAIILLRNDDVMTPSGAISRSTTKTTNVIQRCLTFKEANEVLVALLLPLFRYGIVGASGGEGPRRAGGRQPRAVGGIITTIVRNCAPTGGDIRRVLSMTGGNTILSLLPTPQNTFEGYKRSALRCIFASISGGKEFLPGCSASVPLDVILAKAALGDWEAMDDGDSGSPRGGRGGRGGRGRGIGAGRATSRRTAASEARIRRGYVEEERPPWDCGADPAAEAAQRRARRKAGEWVVGDSDDDGRDDTEEPPRGGGGGSGDAVEREEGAVYTHFDVALPPRLRDYYLEHRRSPVAELVTSLEGVALLNQAKELNRELMFPLLRSAALKVKVGAFMYTYEKAGVSTDLIVKAYQHVAEFLSEAEAL